MGLSYSAEVFYGTFVPEDSMSGERLRKFIDDYGGTPAPVPGHDGVVISEIGAHSTGKVWITVEAKGNTLRYGYGDDVEAPRILDGDYFTRQRRADVEAFLVVADIKNHAPLGWYFGGNVI